MATRAVWGRKVITVGIDPGTNTGLAAVRNGECIYAGSIHGSTWPRWLASARAVLDEVPTPHAVYIEEPEPVIRRAAGMAHHRSGFGLGCRAGAILALCDERMLSPIFVPTSEWWAAWGAEDVARWVWLGGHAFRKGDIESGYQGSNATGPERQLAAAAAAAAAAAGRSLATVAPSSPDALDVARWLIVMGESVRKNDAEASHFLARPNGCPQIAVASVGVGVGVGVVGRPLSGVPSSLFFNGSALDIDPVAVASWLVLASWSFRAGDPESGSCCVPGTPNGKGRHTATTTATTTARVALSSVSSSAIVHGDARNIATSGDLSNCIAYIDPPYANTTGYANSLSRDEVVMLARRWSDAGATVAISEAERIDVPGFNYAIRIDGERKGQKRTFSRQQQEWLTMNREPVVRPSVQGGLFA